MRRMRGRALCGLVRWSPLLLAALLLAGCGPKLKKPSIAITLPDRYNTPDGMVLDAKTGNIFLSCPNTNEPAFKAKILRIDHRDQVSEVVTLPLHPETQKPCGPLGIDIGPDGSLYIADNQSFTDPDYKSRLLRVVLTPGKPAKVEVLATGFIMANAVSCHGDFVYMTESKFTNDTTPPMRSGVYRFKLSELSGDKPIAVVRGGTDPHVVATLETQNMDWVGANGMGFAPDGTLYVCNFGDAQILKFTFDADGKADAGTVVAQGPPMMSCDGMKVDPATGDIYVADFLGNAVHKIDPATGTITTLAKNDDTDGSDGSLDRPSEVCLRGKRIYVSNIDLPLAGNAYDKPHTISVISLVEQ